MGNARSDWNGLGLVLDGRHVSGRVSGKRDWVFLETGVVASTQTAVTTDGAVFDFIELVAAYGVRERDT